MTALRLRGPAPLVGEVRTPGDKSVSHRALILAALADGSSTVRGLSDGDDVARTAAALGRLGAQVARGADGTVRVRGGRDRLSASGPLDCGNSGTGMRLLAGVVAGLAGTSVLVGDESLSARPMDRVARPLTQMGAVVTGRGERCLPPLEVTGGGLSGITWAPEVASAQVKSCVLLAGLAAAGPTVVRERVPTRAHTEEMLAEAGVAVTVRPWDGGVEVRLDPGPVQPRDWVVPGDPSQAAFWVVGACVVPGSAVTVRSVYAGAARTGFLGVLARMGADVRAEPAGGGTADLVARAGALHGTVVEAAEIPSLDEVPALAVAAVAAEGATRFRHVGELRVKEVDRLAATVALVTAFGGRAEVDGDDLVVHGAGGLRPGHLDSGGDHRMAMAAAVAALGAPGASTVTGFEATATSYPGFLGHLVALAPDSGAAEGPR